jgi:hypothetical protein
MELFIDHLEPLLVKHNVSLAIWGHNHAYQRLVSSLARVPAEIHSLTPIAAVRQLQGRLRPALDWR